MQVTDQQVTEATRQARGAGWVALMVLIAMASGRAMTLAFIGSAGDGGPGDPPAAWLMPLVGDAGIGLAAVVILLLVWRRPTPTTWVLAVVWSAIGVFDALAAFIVHTTTPWPEFFMLELFGPTVFFAAAGMHLVIIYLLARTEIRARFGLA
ncbi:MAG: hypothetical protein ACR2QO_09855 [Acidimicrobiales bacterium]